VSELDAQIWDLLSDDLELVFPLPPRVPFVAEAFGLAGDEAPPPSTVRPLRSS
jgi:hypothetical protein